MKIWWNSFKASFNEHFNKWLPRLCSAIVFVLFLGLLACIIALYLKPYLSDFYFENYVIVEHQDYSKANQNGLTIRDKANLRSLINKSKVISIDSVYDRTLSYYDTLITILVALLGLFAFVSYFSMRGKLKGEAEESVREIMDSNFFKRILDCEMEKIIQENLPDYVSEVMDDGKIKRLISQEYELKSDKIKEDVLESLKKPLDVKK